MLLVKQRQKKNDYQICATVIIRVCYDDFWMTFLYLAACVCVCVLKTTVYVQPANKQSVQFQHVRFLTVFFSLK